MIETGLPIEPAAPHPRAHRPAASGRALLLAMAAFALAALPPQCRAAVPAAHKTSTVVLIVSDGLRWQEIFTGAEEDLLNEKEGGSWVPTEELRKRYWRESPAERRAALFPFIWGTVAKQGQIYGNQTLGSVARVTNGKAFSYPGYNEMSTGYPNDAIDSNEYGPNPNASVFEWLNRFDEFRGRVAIYGTWDAYHRIFNEERSGLLMQVGWALNRICRGSRPTSTDQVSAVDIAIQT